MRHLGSMSEISQLVDTKANEIEATHGLEQMVENSIECVVVHDEIRGRPTKRVNSRVV